MCTLHPSARNSGDIMLGVARCSSDNLCPRTIGICFSFYLLRTSNSTNFCLKMFEMLEFFIRFIRTAFLHEVNRPSRRWSHDNGYEEAIHFDILPSVWPQSRTEPEHTHPQAIKRSSYATVPATGRRRMCDAAVLCCALTWLAVGQQYTVLLLLLWTIRSASTAKSGLPIFGNFNSV